MKFKEGIHEKNIIVRCGADSIVPFAMMFGAYIILFGTVSPGGGFQGGVIVAIAVILLYLGYGSEGTMQYFNKDSMRKAEAAAAAVYVLLGFAGVLFTANFCTNLLYNVGKTGSIISAGNITFMSMTVGYKVLTGIGFLLLLMLGILPAREYDIFDKEDGGHKEYWENVKAQAKEDDLV